MRNLRNDDNFCLVTGRTGEAVGMMQWNLAFIANSITDQNIFYRGGGTALPLYLYPEDNAQHTLDPKPARTPNLDMAIVGKIAEKIGLEFRSEPGAVATGAGGETENHPVTEAATPLLRKEGSFFAPIDILDYIYGVLHSPSYREKYKEFLKIDFPRVPYPKDAETFWRLVALGGELRQIHLLESPRVEEFITGYPVGGDNSVNKPVFRNPVAIAPGSDPEVAIAPGSDPEAATAPGSDLDPTGDVYINDTQYFSGVPEAAWNFYIGGYQPAQKWLKDRKGRTLSYDDIRHYQKIIVALTETDRIMKEIDNIDFIDPA